MSAALDTALAELVRREVPTLCLVLDRDDRVAEANRHTLELLGSEVVGARFADLVASFERVLSPTELARGGPTTRTVNWMSHAGLPSTWFCWFVPVPEGTLVLGGLDPREQEALRRELLITTQKLAARGRELQRANAAHRRLAARKDEFLGMAAHDLRAPLQVMAIHTALIAEELGALHEDDVHELLADMRLSVEAMRGIVDAFLDTALIEAGRLELERVPTDVFEVARQASRLVRPTARAQRVAIRLEATTPAPPLEADAGKLQQVVVNLLTNAIQHSAPGEDVAVRVESGADEVVLVVEDRGAGIDPEVRATLFEPWSRSGHRVSGGRGSGLGLAISRRIVESHGGRISVASAPGRGSTFTVRLPRGHG